jgi:hypothetical protein
MMKGHDYMEDPRMSGLAGEPLPVQEVHAWRLAEQDEKQNMDPLQRETHYRAIRERTNSFCTRHGIHLKYASLPIVEVTTP